MGEQGCSGDGVQAGDLRRLCAACACVICSLHGLGRTAWGRSCLVDARSAGMGCGVAECWCCGKLQTYTPRDNLPAASRGLRRRDTPAVQTDRQIGQANTMPRHHQTRVSTSSLICMHRGRTERRVDGTEQNSGSFCLLATSHHVSPHLTSPHDSSPARRTHASTSHVVEC
jgi:hypothetical protein